MLTQARPEFTGADVGYFALPKAVSETGVTTWTDLDEALMASAARCAEGVVKDISAGRFWPPAEGVRYDDFALLFNGDAAECVDPSVLPSAELPA